MRCLKGRRSFLMDLQVKDEEIENDRRYVCIKPLTYVIFLCEISSTDAIYSLSRTPDVRGSR